MNGRVRKARLTSDSSGRKSPNVNLTQKHFSLNAVASEGQFSRQANRESSACEAKCLRLVESFFGSRRFAIFLGAIAAMTLVSRADAGIGRGDRYSGAPWATRSPVLAQHGMAATEQPLASQIAIDILKKGGSAVDAAIAANAAHRSDAAGAERHRRRSVSPSSTIRRPHKLYGYNGSGRAAKGRDLARMKAEVKAAYTKAGMPHDESHSAAGFAAGHRARHGRCVVRAA